MEKTIQIDGVGEFILQTPKAGPRNQAIANADVDGKIKQSVLAFEMLPFCVKAHPWGNKYPSVKQGLDDMDSDKYDLLLEVLGELINPKGDVVKKSEPSSGEGE